MDGASNGGGEDGRIRVQRRRSCFANSSLQHKAKQLTQEQRMEAGCFVCGGFAEYRLQSVPRVDGSNSDGVFFGVKNYVNKMKNSE